MINFNSSIYKHEPELNNFTFSASLKVDEVSEDIQELGEHLPEAGTAVPQKEKAFLSRQSIEARRKNPTVLPSDDKRGPSSTVGTQRRSETYQAAKEIHGADLNDNTPAYIGLLSTAEKRCPTKILGDFMSKSKKFSKKVFPKLYKNAAEQFETSDINILRSVSVFYSKGVMGKKKYRSVYRSLSMTTNPKRKTKTTRIQVMSCSLPRLVPYNKLIKFLNEVDIGTLKSVRESFCSDLEPEDQVHGCYRNLTECLVRLASFYLTTLKAEDFDWFGEPNTFQIAIGGDGAPFGKFDQSCAWLISFLNVGHRVLSNEDNFLIFGSNCSEQSTAAKRYIAMVAKEMEQIEKGSFNVNNTIIKFKFSEFPNDMKMLAFLAGELPNSAKYFSTFADISTGELLDVNKSFGPEPHNDFRPWQYHKRLSVAKKVGDLKDKLNKTQLAPNTKRSKITTFIASSKSRQEFEPLIGKFIDRAHVDPLHLKNNACQHIHKIMLHEAIQKSALGSNVTNMSEVPSDSPFSKFVRALKSKCQLSRLANKVTRWFNETKADGKDFEYRFTGRDSRMYLHNFMHLIVSLESPADTARQTFRLHTFAFVCLQLRNAVSLFCRMTINDDEIKGLSSYCINYFRAYSLFIGIVTPTVWTIGHIVPVHTKDVKSKYGKGLSVTSMEGREAKHIAISRYSQNTNYGMRWQQIFRHEFLSLIWLRERGYNLDNYIPSKDKYVPNRVALSNFCFCGCPKPEVSERCGYCSHPHRQAILLSCQSGKLAVDKKLFT